MTPTLIRERIDIALDKGDTGKAVKLASALHAQNLRSQQMRGLGPNRLRVVR